MRPRWLTLRECGRLMGFPENFILHPDRVSSYQQFGNAVTPPVIAFVAGSVMAAVQGGGKQREGGGVDGMTRRVHAAALRVVLDSMPEEGRGTREEFLEKKIVLKRGGGGFGVGVSAAEEGTEGGEEAVVFKGTVQELVGEKGKGKGKEKEKEKKRGQGRVERVMAKASEAPSTMTTNSRFGLGFAAGIAVGAVLCLAIVKKKKL